MHHEKQKNKIKTINQKNKIAVELFVETKLFVEIKLYVNMKLFVEMIM